MSKQQSERLIRNRVSDIKYQRLTRKGSRGYDRHAFVKLVKRLRKSLVADINTDKMLEELVTATAENVWESKSKASKQMRLPLVVNGTRIDDEVTFKDKTTKSGHRTVLSDFVTIRQHRWHCDLLLEKVTDAQKAHAAELAANESALQRAGGNADALMRNFRDAA